MLQEILLVFACSQIELGLIKCFSMKNPIKSNPCASNSVLLSLAAHVTYHFPHLDLTNNPNLTPKIIPQKSQINSYLTIHPLQQFWCDKFSQAILNNHAIRKQNTLYLVFELNTKQKLEKVKKYKEKLNSFDIILRNNEWHDEVLKHVSGYDQLPRKNNKIAYLNVSGSQLRTDLYKPILNVRANILGQIYNNQNWLSYQILKGNIPTFQEFLSLDAVIIPGSTNSVLSDIQEIKKMTENLFNAFALSKKLKIFGICYGHQLIAKQSKADVVRKIRTDKIQNYQLQQSKILELKSKFEFLSSLPSSNDKPLLLLQHHQDYVETVPQDFHLLAKSATSKVEVLLHNSGRILSFQSHPEYYYEYTQGYLERLMKYQKINMSSQYKIRGGDQNFMNNHHQSSNLIRKVISQFLNWKADQIN